MNKFCEYKKIYTTENERVIQKQFPRLNEECYLDHAGATLYSQDYIDNVFRDLSVNLYGNPHTTNTSSKASKDAIDIVRLRILDWFHTNAQEYSVIFTSGATASLKLVAESFNYSNNSAHDKHGSFAYLESSHTSVLGMREYARSIKPLPPSKAFELLSVQRSSPKAEELCNTNSLLVYPAQCNFSGIKYPLQWVEATKKGLLNEYVGVNSRNWYVLLDAAAYVPTSVLNLTKYKPDFVAISFYKVFGYPTGLGALLVRNSSKGVLVKKYYGGGTVQLAISSDNFYIPRVDLHEMFEDGTLPFLSIISISHALKAMDRLNINFYMISQHVFNLAQYLYRNLLVMHHSNGKRVAVIYCDTNYQSSEDQGGIVTFNLMRSNGDYIGYSEVLHASNLFKIHVRTGCFCNPGACQRHLGLTIQDVYKHYEAGHICGDQHDLVDGYPTGCVRVSFGYMSKREDVDKLLHMIKECFIDKPVVLKIPSNWKSMTSRRPSDTKERIKKSFTNESCEREKTDKSAEARLQQIYLYPVKSCAGFKVTNQWEISSTGLRYDRQWMIVNEAGVCVSQKQNKNLYKIQPIVDLKNNNLRLVSDGFGQIELPLNVQWGKSNSAEICQSKICGKVIQGWDCGDAVASWLDAVLNSSGFRLLRQFESLESFPLLRDKDGEKLKMSLANKAQYLLLNKASVQWLRDRMSDTPGEEDIDSTIQRFRPNFVIDTDVAFVENKAKYFSFNRLHFEVTGKCTRCQVICVDQKTGNISKEPLVTLSREMQGDISFGVYLKRENISRNFVIDVGSPVEIHFK